MILFIVLLAAVVLTNVLDLVTPKPGTTVLPGEEPPVTKLEDSLKESHITLEDGRTINCVIYDDFRQGGVSCDWDSASLPK